MEIGTSKKLVVTNAQGDHYIPLNRIICLLVNNGYCTIYYLNPTNTLASLESTKRMRYFFDQTEGQMIEVHRNACVNPHYISALLSTFKIQFSVEGLPSVFVADRKYRKTRAHLRKLAFTD